MKLLQKSLLFTLIFSIALQPGLYAYTESTPKQQGLIRRNFENFKQFIHDKKDTISSTVYVTLGSCVIFLQLANWYADWQIAKAQKEQVQRLQSEIDRLAEELAQQEKGLENLSKELKNKIGKTSTKIDTLKQEKTK